MLKAYAVAMMLATTTPVVIKSVESVQAPENTPVATTTAATATAKNGSRRGTVRW
jgi:hypothetical protein